MTTFAEAHIQSQKTLAKGLANTSEGSSSSSSELHVTARERAYSSLCALATAVLLFEVDTPVRK